jgi:hypothetical protein
MARGYYVHYYGMIARPGIANGRQEVLMHIVVALAMPCAGPTGVAHQGPSALLL